MRFTDCHANVIMCSPSRAALLTGRYQQRSGVEFVLGPDPAKTPGMAADELTFAHLLQDAGYATGMFGKYHTGHIPHQSPNKMGFEVFRGQNGGMDHHSRFDRWGQGVWYHDERRVEDEEGYSTKLITDHALAFIEANRDRPFLCYVADWMVHFPWQGPSDPADFRKGVDNSAPEKKYGSVADRKRAYREMVEAMDGSVGRIIARLRELGLAENTFFFFSSDNGGHELVCNNEPLRGHKGSIYEGGHRVPGIAYWPGHVPSGQTCDETILLFDLMPTLLALSGIQSPPGRRLDGTNLLPILNGQPGLPERTLFWRQGRQKAARRGEWKLLHDPNGPRLFNLSTDLGETIDRAADEPGTVVCLQEELDQWEAELDAPATMEMNDE